jgi:short-subunit dehydrogenase
MRDLHGRTALVTGASRGLGRSIAGALGEAGAALGLVARSADDLRRAAGELGEEHGVPAAAIPADLTDRGALEAAARRARSELGPVDVLVNNAGVMNARPYHLRAPDDIEHGVRLNLLAPLLLTRLLLPGMVERGRGHVVNVSSLAGKAGPPFEEVYGATKAGLIGFTQSLRREYHGTGVSASVVCPGYVTGAGMYADAAEETGARAPGRAGRATPGGVAEAVVRAILEDRPEVFVNSAPVRPLTVLSEASPRLGEWLTRKLDLFRAFEEGAEATAGQGRTPEGGDA